MVLTPDVNLVGRPPSLYKITLELLDTVSKKQISAEDLLIETIRQLIIFREERQQRIKSLLKNLKGSNDKTPLSSEAIISLIQQHLQCKGSSRLPVLVIAAAYEAAKKHLGERVLPLKAHTSADKQTGALGDVQITLLQKNDIVTAYEMKNKKVTHEDIDRALQKIAESQWKVDNYVFVTTEEIEEGILEYAKTLYETTGGIEVAILDCISFIRHFLHLFHRLRMQYLETYQNLVLQEPESAVSQPLKEVFLALRQSAESTEANG